MIVTLQTERIRTIEQVATFVKASGPVDFHPRDRTSAHEFVTRTLARLPRPGRGKRHNGHSAL